MVIVLEGLDGSGKATQARMLVSELERRGMRVKQVSFPDYDSDSSALVKMYLAGEFGDKPSDVNAFAASSFFAVDRYASFKRNWEKDWQEGIVVADRYTTSNAVHQCSKLEKSQWDAYLDWLFHFEYELLGIPAPNLVVYLRVDPAVSQQLLAKRYEGDLTKEDIHEKDKAYLARCQEAAGYCAERLGWRTIECTSDGKMRGVEEIAEEIFGLLHGILQDRNDSKCV